MKTETIPAFLAPKLAALTVLMTTALQAGTLDLSNHFDAASDFTAISVEFNYEEVAGNPPIVTTNFTTSIADLGGSPNVIEFLVDRDDAGAAALSFLSTATFDPSTQGMLRSINWSTTVTDPDTALKDDGANFPLLVQSGTLYRYTGGGIQDSDHGTLNAFMNSNADTFPQSISSAVATDFEELDVTTPDWTDGFGPNVVGGSHPDFSETGGAITFGYLTTSRTGNQRYLGWGGDSGGTFRRFYFGWTDSGDQMTSAFGAVTGHANTAEDPSAGWVLYTSVWDAGAGTVSIYENTTLLDTDSLSVSGQGAYEVTGTHPFNVGKNYDPAGAYFNGIMDDLAIWNGALTVDQINDAITFGADGMSSMQCLDGLTCTTDPVERTATLAWKPPSPALQAAGLKVMRNGVASESFPVRHPRHPGKPGNR